MGGAQIAQQAWVENEKLLCLPDSCAGRVMFLCSSVCLYDLNMAFCRQVAQGGGNPVENRHVFHRWIERGSGAEMI